MKAVRNRFRTFRENYELRQVFLWLAGMIYFSILGAKYEVAMLSLMFQLICGVMILTTFPAAAERLNRTMRLAGTDLPVVDFEELKTLTQNPSHLNDMWLGKGFTWGQAEAQLAYDMLGRNWQNVTREALGPLFFFRFWRRNKLLCLLRPMYAYRAYIEEVNKILDVQGAEWIHALGDEEQDIFQPISHAEGHTLIVGTTGAGKTRCFDLLISQAILRGEAVIILDPKGDADLKNKAKRACEALGRGHNFVSFHPGFPENSIRINLLANFTHHTELASRICALLPSGGTSAAFTSFAFQAMSTICYGLMMTGKRPSLSLIKHYLTGTGSGVLGDLVHDALLAYFKANSSTAYDLYQKIDASKGITVKFISAMIEIYRNVPDLQHSSDIDDLIKLFTHPEEHFSKMITSLLPTLTMLTSGTLENLLSPAEDEDEQSRQIWYDTKGLIENNSVVYVGLDSLSNSMVGSAIGTLFLSDLASTAGSLYNYGTEQEAPKKQSLMGKLLAPIKEVYSEKKRSASGRIPVNVFVDEASEISCPPFLQILNKGRGAGLRAFVATQTIADFASKMGSQAQAMQLLANLNNRIILRCVDGETQQYVAGIIPKTRIANVERSQGISSSAGDPIPKGGSVTERQTEKEAPLFTPEMLGMLPNLQYIGIISGTHLIKGRFPLILTNKSEYRR